MAVGKELPLDQKLRRIVSCTAAWPKRRGVNSAISPSAVLLMLPRVSREAESLSPRVASSLL